MTCKFIILHELIILLNRKAKTFLRRETELTNI